MARVTYRLATPAATLHVAKHLREADRVELQLSHGPHVVGRIMESLEQSGVAWNAFVDHMPVNIFGVVEIDRHSGSPWMVGTDTMMKHRRELLVDARLTVEDMNAAYPLLFNYVHAENSSSIRWLRWLGFTLDPAVPHGPHGALFHPFYRHHNV